MYLCEFSLSCFKCHTVFRALNSLKLAVPGVMEHQDARNAANFLRSRVHRSPLLDLEAEYPTPRGGAQPLVQSASVAEASRAYRKVQDCKCRVSGWR